MDIATRKEIPNGHHLMHHEDSGNYANDHRADEFEEGDRDNPEGMKNKQSTEMNSGMDRSRDKQHVKEEIEGRSTYVSKEYKVHWRERERIQKVINKEKELEKDFVKREKEWIELEEQIKNDTYKEWNKLQQIKKKDIAKLIELDLKGEQENANLSTSKRREMRNSKRRKEKELDDLDRHNEMREAEEANRRKEQLDRDKEQAAREIDSKSAKEANREEAKDAPHEGENQTENKSDESPEEEIVKANHPQENENRANISKSKSSFFMNALSFVFDRSSEGKAEEKGEDALHGEASGTANEKGEAKEECATSKGEAENDNAENADVDKTCVENCMAEEAEDKSPMETRTSKRKPPAAEPINIKVNEKKKKKKNIDSERATRVSTRKALQNVFNTNDEDEMFGRKKRPVAKLDGKGKGAKEEEEEERAAEEGAAEEGAAEEGAAEEPAEHAEPEENIQTIDVIENSKKILEMVPSNEEEIFNFPIDWKILNQKGNIITKLKPWICKKITEYIGSDEKEITGQISNYFVDQVLNERTPKEMLVQAEKFLDADAKKFILNMYRLIIFEQLKVTNVT
ncbi:RNA-binding protein 25, putative [Plasmodium knowlesi strain H]|uniref:RNA-binding protein 25, putative n=3 Tax=Plasmodium knowlesi TaxID=5850 RepID=B3L7V2_PLAKH|nr:RNA-binding protein 25, putative [Plasmodium knowlesi strain H]OTN64357.1 Uncharacterized protein PKNOH_S130206400 [Plasmodium knowlesi]CAA9989225.1 RNA-binding protein 25, putative [Plasmodium knowlesi strain H]SBO27170.1 conserved Plasmodium protein, unknown function [Plasmodium knowlesi strain H]VVS78699.1 RNA-binding protein 25, putative [Plasmodium knowlesi strain H]|eukprot:XP_002261570.1 hypothetical protein, conserved in Plasmodium species [Plasmodium knowlesi strain H]